MKDIDLSQFAYHSQKLPAKFLNHYVTKSRVKVSTLLQAHLIDFVVCLMGSTFLASAYNFSVRGLLVTRGLRSAFASQDTTFISMLLLPAIMLSYFYISFFLNDGQTLGMYWKKSRIAMKSMDFKETYHWAFESLTLLMTGGISYFFHHEKWQNFQEQDYRYQEMMLPKVDYSLDLIEMTKHFDHVEVEEEFAEAA